MKEKWAKNEKKNPKLLLTDTVQSYTKLHICTSVHIE